MKCLLIGDVCDRYFVEFISEILSKRDDCTFDILTTGDINSSDLFFRKDDSICNVYYSDNEKDLTLFGKHIGKIWQEFLAYSICREYDEIIVYNVDLLSFAVKFFSKQKTKIILCYLGSDLLRVSKKRLWLLRGLVRKSSTIVVENEHMKKCFEDKYGLKNSQKVKFAHYGTTNVDSMLKNCNAASSFSREDFGISNEKKSVYIGYNGGRSQRHIDIIRSLKMLPEEVKNDIFLVLHCAYGLDSTYGDELEEELDGCGIENRIVTEYMTGNRLASFRSCADILINWQPSDCMSASMVESMELGVIVINGSWLIYPDIIKYGGYYESVDNEEELLQKIIAIANDINKFKEKTSVNKGVLNILRWNINEWAEVLS